MAASKSAQDELERIKKNISTYYLYFQDNFKRFHNFRDMVFRTSLNDQQRALLQMEGKPAIEFNILEAYISRLCGEFVANEPSIEVTPGESLTPNVEQSEMVEGHLRHILYEADKDSMSYEIYKDLLTGGFSAIKVFTEYSSPMSMRQVVKMRRVFDPTLCGFDPMARASHKADGNFCFELYPMTEEDFHQKYPDAKTDKISYMSSLEEFRWGYKNDKGDKTVLVADYYEKKKKRVQIVELADGKVIQKRKYDEFLQNWNASGYIEQPPVVMGAPRWTMLETICRYTVIGTQVLNYEETDYTMLPIIFADGNSIDLRQGTSGVSYQMTRPYIYHAKGVQDLKNFAGQCLANYLGSIVQHKFIVKKEALPQEEDFLDAFTDTQRASTLVVNAFSENNPELPIPEPIREVANVPAPPEVMGAFQITDPTTQAILGSFASNLTRDNSQLSGKAVVETISADNAASMPYINGYLQALTQAANVAVSLFPNYLKGKRQLPVVNKEGDRSYESANQPGGTYLDYEDGSYNVCVSAGVNFNVEKNRAMQQIISLMSASQEFNQFMNSPIGLPVLVDNLTIRSADILKESLPKFFQQQQQAAASQQQMAAQMAQNDPRMVKAQADMLSAQSDAMQKQLDAKLSQMQLQFDQLQAQIENQIEISKATTQDKLADAQIMLAESKVTQAQVDSAVKIEESNTSLKNHALDAAAKIAEINSRKHQDKIDLHEAALKEMDMHHEHLMDIHHANQSQPMEQ